jgi:hypothetical protein
MPKKIILVSCVSKKNLSPLPDCSLYISDWFKKAAQYASQFSAEWYILSAKCGLVLPDQVIEPYNITLKSMRKDARRNWARQVWTMLEPFVSPGYTVVFLAGEIYRENLVESVIRQNCYVIIPMEGLNIG